MANKTNRKSRTLRGVAVRLLGERNGAIAVESAFAMSFLMVALAAVIDFGGYVRLDIELKQALRAGGQYALDLGAIGEVNYNDEAAIQAAIEPVIRSAAQIADADLTITSVSTECVCPDGNSGPQFCTGDPDVTFTPCSNDLPGERFLHVDAQATFSPFFTFLPYFEDAMTIQENLEMRVQ